MPSQTSGEEFTRRKPPSDRAGFLYRLSIYFIGIAIGFMILGMFRARSAAEARQRAAQQAANEAQFGTPADPAKPELTAAPAAALPHDSTR